jgi:hypothetical protein
MQRLQGILLLAAAGLVWAGPARAEDAIARTPAPKGVELYFITPQDGQRVSSPVTVRFGLRGMGVAPAGVAKPKTGHHHLVLDVELPSLDEPVPSDEHHLHFGGGQTEVTLELAPGPHTLQLLLGDQNHVPHRPAVVSKRIRISVE